MGDVPIDDSPFPLTDVDRWVLSQTDEEYQYHDWDELKRIIGETRSLSLGRPARCRMLWLIHASDQQPVRPQEKAVRPATVHEVDGRHQGRVRVPDKLPPGAPATKGLGHASLPGRITYPLCRAIRLQGPAERLAVRAHGGRDAHCRLDEDDDSH